MMKLRAVHGGHFVPSANGFLDLSTGLEGKKNLPLVWIEPSAETFWTPEIQEMSTIYFQKRHLKYNKPVFSLLLMSEEPF